MHHAAARLRHVALQAQERVKSHDGASTSQASDVPTASIRAAIAHVSQGLVERDTEARLLILAALAGEQILFLGPPGTAKSELARRLNSCLSGSRYFERLLTRFSVPEELFGPLSMRALEQDTYLRNTKGYLPAVRPRARTRLPGRRACVHRRAHGLLTIQLLSVLSPAAVAVWADTTTRQRYVVLISRCGVQAEVAFIDEVFKANSAILNTLLTLLNERLFDNGNERVPVPLVCLVAASNELPESEELDALYDRFLIRCNVRQVRLGATAS